MLGSNNFEIGNTSNATQGRDLRRYTLQDSLTWQKGSHRFRFGTELERAPGTGFWGYCDPACGQVASPEFVKSVIPAAYLPLFNLLTTISSDADLLRLPLLGAVVGLGDPSQPPPFNVNEAKTNNRYRLYFRTPGNYGRTSPSTMVWRGNTRAHCSTTTSLSLLIWRLYTGAT